MLPRLRAELHLLPGPDGWTLFDPVRNRYFRLGEGVARILAHWDAGDVESVAARVRDDGTPDIDAKDVVDVVAFLAEQELLVPERADQVDALARRAERLRGTLLRRFLHAYLFVRFPLVRPDRFLTATLHHVRFLAGRGFLWATLAALALGLFLVGRQWDAFHAAAVGAASLHGVVLSGLALGLVKVLHELGHAYVVKAKGCRVPTMGVALMVLWPVLYTDTNESWRLTARRDRLAVAGAGILTELAVAAWATLLWGVLPDGPARGAVFLLAAVTWISSLLINLSPFMRFDGYFLLMDWLDFPNLHPRSFALARWHLREMLFGLGHPPPEQLSPARLRGLVAFAYGVWAYRLVLFLGIAALVYGFFIKLVGLALFAVEIGWFVLRPLYAELRQWWRLRHAIGRRGSWRLVLLGGTAAAVLLLPWESRVSAPAMLKAAQHMALYPGIGGRVEAVVVRDGTRVTQGLEVLRLAAPDLEHSLAQAERRVRLADYETASQSLDATLRERGQALRESAAAALAEAVAARRELERATLRAPMTGMVVDMVPDLAAGQWLGGTERVLSIRAEGPPVIDAYVGEREAARLHIGARGRFVAEGLDLPIIPCRLTAVDADAVRRLPDAALAAPAGGDIAVRADGGAAGLVPDNALYHLRCEAEQETPAATAQRRGHLVLEAERQSPAAASLRWIVSVLVRESGM